LSCEFSNKLDFIYVGGFVAQGTRDSEENREDPEVATKGILIKLDHMFI
jgi:hypothetical protein